MEKYRLTSETAFVRLILLMTIALAAVLPAGSASAHLSCDAGTIQGLVPAGTTITSAATVTKLTTYCDVKGSITTNNGQGNVYVLFELGLPVAWNGSFLFWGNGGFGGSVQQPFQAGTFDFLLTFGLAVAMTDTGHESSAGFYDFLDGSFGLSGGQPDLAAREDFEYRAVHQTTVDSQRIVQAYYAPPYPIYYASYFDGCSTGGRQALVEAQQFPHDFRAIVAGDPGIGDPIAGFNWNAQALLQTPSSYLSPSDIELVDQAVMKECDGIDGVVDGLIQDPRKCNFDPATLLCTTGQTSNCLKPQQINTLKAIFSGAVGDGNVQLYPGYEPSDMGGPDGWPLWITGFTPPQLGVAEPWGPPPASFPVAPFQWSTQDQYLKYFVFNDPNYNSLNFNTYNPLDMKALAAPISAYPFVVGENTDLSAFFNLGGKLVMYHGFSDAAVAPQVSVDYYTGVANTLYRGDFSQLQDHARLFMVPGMHHCGGGPGPNVFDPLGPAALWALGFAPPPAQIIATHYVDNDQTKPVDRTMPLCPYPQVAKYVGGPVDVASSWTCSN
jgi:feruloyl esterase